MKNAHYKVKDNVDLKELEKYMFTKSIYGYVYFPENNIGSGGFFNRMEISENTREIKYNLQGRASDCNSLTKLKEDFKNIKNSYKAFTEKIQTLLDDGLLEEIEEKK